MFAYPAPLWRDPLFSPEDRFPLGPPQGINCQERPSGAATRPFSLVADRRGSRVYRLQFPVGDVALKLASP